MLEKKTTTKNCEWPSTDPLMINYHDEEWGVPVHDDRKLFEFIVLDCFQAGLSWKTVLHKRENFRKAFDNFDFCKIADFNDDRFEILLQDAGIIRNRAKIKGPSKMPGVSLRFRKNSDRLISISGNSPKGRPFITNGRTCRRFLHVRMNPMK